MLAIVIEKLDMNIICFNIVIVPKKKPIEARAKVMLSILLSPCALENFTPSLAK